VATVDGCRHEWLYAEDDPLVGRLRCLQWAEVPSEVRERCWERISSRIAELQARDQTPPAPLIDTGERYAFSRRQAPCRLAVAQIWSGSARGSRRPAISVG
jgi:hypothetical protein